jgi:hypothetical protein
MKLLKQFWEPGLGRTILFSLAVVSFVIGAYQTVLQNDENALTDNYLWFMTSFVCVLSYRYLKLKEDEKLEKEKKTLPKPTAKQPDSRTKPVPRNKRRG